MSWWCRVWRVPPWNRCRHRSAGRPGRRPSMCRHKRCAVSPDSRDGPSRFRCRPRPSSFFFSRACTCASVRMPPSSATMASSAFRRALNSPDRAATRSTARRAARQRPPVCATRWRCGLGHWLGSRWQIGSPNPLSLGPPNWSDWACGSCVQTALQNRHHPSPICNARTCRATCP
jgi:hypothetical protein